MPSVTGAQNQTVVASQNWYLVAPPLSAPFGPRAIEVADEAPLNQWSRIGAFETAVECEAGRAVALAKAGDEMKRVAKLSPRPADWQDRFLSSILGRKRAVVSQCVAATDGRLASPQ